VEGAQPGNQRVPIFTKSLYPIVNQAKCQVKLWPIGDCVRPPLRGLCV
jgi:hypothetical protein